GLADDRLADAVARAVSAAEQVRRLQERLRELLAGAPAEPTAQIAVDVSDQHLTQPIGDLAPESGTYFVYGRARTRTSMLPQIRAVAAALRGDSDAGIPP